MKRLDAIRARVAEEREEARGAHYQQLRGMGISQPEAAMQAGISKRHAARWEKGAADGA